MAPLPRRRASQKSTYAFDFPYLDISIRFILRKSVAHSHSSHDDVEQQAGQQRTSVRGERGQRYGPIQLTVYKNSIQTVYTSRIQITLAL